MPFLTSHPVSAYQWSGYRCDVAFHCRKHFHRRESVWSILCIRRRPCFVSVAIDCREIKDTGPGTVVRIAAAVHGVPAIAYTTLPHRTCCASDEISQPLSALQDPRLVGDCSVVGQTSLRAGPGQTDRPEICRGNRNVRPGYDRPHRPPSQGSFGPRTLFSERRPPIRKCATPQWPTAANANRTWVTARPCSTRPQIANKISRTILKKNSIVEWTGCRRTRHNTSGSIPNVCLASLRCKFAVVSIRQNSATEYPIDSVHY
jgi:hypothetical protein